MKHRVFDDEFKKMAVELSRVKASVKEATGELGLDPSRLSKWRNNPAFNGPTNNLSCNSYVVNNGI